MHEQLFLDQFRLETLKEKKGFCYENDYALPRMETYRIAKETCKLQLSIWNGESAIEPHM